MKKKNTDRKKTAYLTIGDDLQQQIESGELKSGDQLQSLRELAQEYSVSPVTVTRAINILKDAGLVETTWGGGCFVANAKEKQALDVATTLVISRDYGQDYDLNVVNYWKHIVSEIILGAQDQFYRLHIRNQIIFVPSNSLGDAREFGSYLKGEILEANGFLCLCGDMTTEIATYLSKRLNGPVVSSDLFSELEGFNCIQVNIYANAFKIMKHLIDNGHERIACIAGRDAGNPYYQARVKAYRDALSDFGCEQTDDFFGAEDRELAIKKSCEALLEEVDTTCISAAFCLNDFRAIVLYELACEMGISVPGQLAIAGFDGTPKAIETGITTVQLPFHTLGREAVLLLDSLVSGEVEGPVQKKISTGVIGSKTTFSDKNNA